MDEEKQVSQDSSSVEQSTTDGSTEELVNAAKEAEGKKESKPVEKTAEQLAHEERSNLGRKVKKLEDTISELTDIIQELRASRQTVNAPQADMPEYISTPDDVERVLTARERKQKEEQARYQGAYAKTFRGLGKNESDYEEVFNEMFEHFNEVRTGDPEVDAELNYAKAKASLLSKKLAGPAKAPKANVKGSKTEVSTNLSVESRADDTPGADVQLDEFAKEFVAKTKMNNESVKDALKSETPIHLRGR